MQRQLLLCNRISQGKNKNGSGVIRSRFHLEIKEKNYLQQVLQPQLQEGVKRLARKPFL
jgi:hypothetical protein